MIGPCFSDEIELKNGDIIHGELIDINKNRVLWHSEVFDLLSIPVANVLTIGGKSFLEEQMTKDAYDLSKTSLPYFHGSISLTGSASSGNQERRNWDLDTTLQRRKNQFRQIANLEYESHSLNDRDAKNSYNIRYAADWFFRDSWFWRNELSFGADQARALDQIVTIGSAAGHQFWTNDNSALSSELGLLWIAENQTDHKINETLTLSWSLDYSKSVSSRLDFFHKHDLTISIQDLQDNQAEIDVGLRIPLIKDLFTEIKFEWIYDNQPAAGADNLDSQFSIGINYAW